VNTHDVRVTYLSKCLEFIQEITCEGASGELDGNVGSQVGIKYTENRRGSACTESVQEPVSGWEFGEGRWIGHGANGLARISLVPSGVRG
jgi:hypothetical protein